MVFFIEKGVFLVYVKQSRKLNNCLNTEVCVDFQEGLSR